MSSTHDFLRLSQLHSALSRIRMWLFGPAASEKSAEMTLDRAVAEAEELAESMERVMPRVYAQAYALANKSETMAYWMVEWREEGVERMRKVLEMEKVGERPRGMNEVRDSLSYLVELENLKLSSVQTHNSAVSLPSPHSPSRSPANSLTLTILKQFLALYAALGLNPRDSLSLRDLLTEDNSLISSKVLHCKADDILERFLFPIMELIGCEEAAEKCAAQRPSQVLFSRLEAERLAQDCARECHGLIASALHMCGEAAAEEDSLSNWQLQPWPECLPSLSAQVRISLLKLQKVIMTLSQSHRLHTSALNTLRLSNSLLKNLLKVREQELETLGEEYHSFATQNTVSNEPSRRRVAASPSVQRLPASRQESDTFSDLRSPLTGRLMTSFPEEDALHTDETIDRITNPVPRAVINIENIERLAIVLHLDSERQIETAQSAFRLWVYSIRSQRLVTDMSKSALEHASLEGSFKAKVLKSNPIVGLLSANILSLDEMLPSYELFPILFQVLDSASCQSDCSKSFPEMTLDYFSLTLPIKTKVYQFLGNLLLSLQSYYAEGYSYAVFFARLLRVYNPDPLLDQVSFCFLRLNAYLMDVAMQSGVKALSVKMADEELGGNVFISTALELAFRLPFSLDPALFSHFLACIKPEELSTLEWATFVIACKADYLMVDLSNMKVASESDIFEFLRTALSLESIATLLQPESFSPATLVDLIHPLVYADIKTFLFMPRGFLLDAFLQVYDLFVDSLFPLVSQYADGQIVTESQFGKFVQEICPGIRAEENADLWAVAGELSQDSMNVAKDAALLAVLVSENPALAAKPLFLREVEARSPAGHSKGISFEYRNGRVAVSFREERSQHRRKTSALQSRYGRVRITRDLAANNS